MQKITNVQNERVIDIPCIAMYKSAIKFIHYSILTHLPHRSTIFHSTDLCKSSIGLKFKHIEMQRRVPIWNGCND